MADNKNVDASSASAQESVEARRKPTPEEAKAMLEGAYRQHLEGLGLQWGVLLGGHPQQLMSQVVATVLQEGGTRPVWQWKVKNDDFVVMAWPQDSPVRASVTMSGPEGEKMRPVDACPLLEGLPNDMTVAELHPWQAGIGGNVGCTMEEGRKPLWFYDPMMERDHDDLTPGVTQTILLAGLALSLRKALLDELTITQGSAYEVHAESWLQQNPGKSRLDVPPLKIPLSGKHLIMPGQSFCEYQMRATVAQVEDCMLEKMPVKLLYLHFPFESREAMHLALYAPKTVLKDYEPKEGDEIDAYVWLQGRIVDLPPSSHDEMPEHVSPLQ